ncbi:MAG: hypothetical protein ACI4JT_09660 [Oscillospiraceae bacterium]
MLERTAIRARENRIAEPFSAVLGDFRQRKLLERTVFRMLENRVAEPRKLISRQLGYGYLPGNFPELVARAAAEKQVDFA